MEGDEDVTEIKRLQKERAAFGSSGTYDQELYGNGNEVDGDKYAGYVREIPTDGAEMEEIPTSARLVNSFTAPKELLDEAAATGKDEDPFKDTRIKSIAERESDYHAKRRTQVLPADRAAAVEGGATYADVMKERMLEREQVEMKRAIEKKREGGDLPDGQANGVNGSSVDAVQAPPAAAKPERKRRRWDVADPSPAAASEMSQVTGKTPSRWDQPASTPRQRKWDVEATPATPSMSSVTGSESSVISGQQWDSTPGPATTTKRSRWDMTPEVSSQGVNPMATPQMGFGGAATPLAMAGMQTPMASTAMTPEAYHSMRYQMEVDERNRPLTDEEIDQLVPSEGYVILEPPAGYQAIRTPARKLMATPTPSQTPQFRILGEEGGLQKGGLDAPEMPESLQGISMKPDDYQTFSKILNDVDESKLSSDEQKERRIMRLLLRVKNGTPPMRKAALRHLTDKARDFGAGPLINSILPLLIVPTLEDHERHLLVKVIDRVLYKLDDLVRPYVHKILVPIEPLLIDEDYYARVEGREIISNLAKAAGLATMIATMRPDIDNSNEYVRNTTARAFAVVASALGIPSLLPFLKAVCKSKKSWQARHTGTKIVQQIAILMGCAVLPHLRSMVQIIENGLNDEQGKVRTICALALAALAEAASPYGIESFDSVLRPLWKGIRQHRGKTLVAFLKAIGFIIPLMDAEYASYYTKEVMVILVREFQSPDIEMKRIVLKVVKQCVQCEGVEPDYVRTDILPEFFRCFWVRRMALDKPNYRQLVETTVELANRVGGAEIIGRLVDDLKDESEPYRRMVVETIEKICSDLGVSDIDQRLEERLFDGMLHAFQEQGSDENPAVLNGLGTLVSTLGLRSKPYLQQLASMIKWRLNNKSAKIRQQSADLVSKIAPVMKKCDEEELMGHLGVVLYEYLGEEFPDVLGSILGGLKSIVNVIGIAKMTPPVQDLLPRLTPILKNRQEKVQENCIDLVGRIADRGPEFVSSREWMRICFELLELLKAPKKAIRRATVSTFGYIAKAIGPSDVLATLLNNLKVQERQQRVCTTVAIAIVAETCQPFTVLPALMNEYKIPELNVQNGVLKSLSFLFEYIGEMAKDYIYAVTPLLEDALIDRDLVHRQTACSAVGHLALGVQGLGCEDALVHLLNHVWPNIFETSPHVINAVVAAIQGMMVALGPSVVLCYLLQGLFHPARHVREIYWKIYNSLYVYAQDGLSAAYPRIPDDTQNNNSYARPELDLVI
eukprot:CAMPEP_0198726480 /NCGR_PEP_ID=MMETSP1475-20131203/3519_1 /TAXON_ID= ORGANISM="Unidentified sp., Strain CCMP1999" /NCGR_SAMPLE_ID=MMETSP1475 /ASSEMBLY_ACC=CAM_ASM_001111 /LENGTH=1242 /DNA_ID=CAMNT_0044488403 /DNA_START=6 /DNA_END=3734 /DNA_ORIENTATION=+